MKSQRWHEDIKEPWSGAVCLIHVQSVEGVGSHGIDASSLQTEPGVSCYMLLTNGE